MDESHNAGMKITGAEPLEERRGYGYPRRRARQDWLMRPFTHYLDAAKFWRRGGGAEEEGRRDRQGWGKLSEEAIMTA